MVDYSCTIEGMEEVQELSQWVAQTISGDSWRAVAEKLHTTHPTIQRRLKNHEADAIVEIARAYDANPIPGLIAAGTITSDDVTTFAGKCAADDLTDVELARIIVERLEAQEANEYPQFPYLQAVADSSDEEGHDYPDDFEP